MHINDDGHTAAHECCGREDRYIYIYSHVGCVHAQGGIQLPSTFLVLSAVLVNSSTHRPPSFLSTPTPSPLSTYAQVSHSLPLIPDHRESIFILYIRRAVCVPSRRLLHNVSARLARYKLGPRIEYSSGD